MMRETIIHLAALWFTWAAVAYLIIMCFVIEFGGKKPTFPPDYSVVDQARAIVEANWWEEEGQRCS